MDLTFGDNQILHKELTERIIQCFYVVYNTLGYGFLENVYQNALYIELKKNGFTCEAQKDIKVYYDSQCVGNYRADLIVDNLIILELKAAEELNTAHALQLLNYLKATNYEVGLLLNFGKKPEIRRKIFQNIYK